jgi:hypothetical protein
MAYNRNLLTLTVEEKQELEGWAQSRTLPAGDVFRARLILALAEGKSYREIEHCMHTSAATIARWRTRFERHRLTGLEGRHQGSRPRIAAATVQARVVRRVQQRPKRWQHPLVVPETGPRVRDEQVHGATHSDPSALEAASSGTVFGQ